MKFLLMLVLIQIAGPTGCAELQNVHLQIPVNSGPVPQVDGATKGPQPQMVQPNIPTPPPPVKP